MSQEPQVTQESPAAPEAGAPPPGGRLFRYRNALGVAVAAFLCLWPWGRLPPAAWQFIAGGAVILAGVSLRLWCILQIGGSARKTSRLKAEKVISWGPYSIVRNPIYIANSLTFVGFTLAAGLPWAAPIVLVALGLWYDSIVRREEQFIAEMHPAEYAAYRSMVRRWIPRLRYRGRPPEVPPYPFRRALKRERGHLIAVGCGVLAVVALRVAGIS
jgi:protein-S-isoprenylcysteine O-methyltransferase Ste14